MKKTTAIIFAITTGLLSSCRKDFNCTCTNSGGIVTIYQMKNFKDDAKKQCDSYSQELKSSSVNPTACLLK